MYRIHVGTTRGSASWGKTHHYESEDAFLRALLSFRMSYEARQARGFLHNLFDYWLDKINGDEPTQITQIYRVEKLVDMEWTPLDYKFIPPSIELTHV